MLAWLSLVLTVCAYATVRRVLRPAAGCACAPPVSILKPLKGDDDGLYENLASFARLDYPCFQIVFGASDPCDPALAVARRVQRDFPDVDIVVHAGALPFGKNPKVENLASLSRRARYGYWLVSDSNTRVRPDYLRALARPFADPAVGMTTCLFAGTRERTVGACLENQHLNSFVASGMTARQVYGGTALVIGKSMLFRRRDLEALGGWASVRDILAEDYVLADRFRNAGWRAVTAPHVVETVNTEWTIARFAGRHLRWAQMRRRCSPRTFFCEPLLNPAPWTIACALLGAPGTAALVLCGKALADQCLARRLRGHGYRARHVPLLPLKDLAGFALWAVASVRRRVCWRGHPLRIGPGSRLLDPAPRAPDRAPVAIES